MTPLIHNDVDGEEEFESTVANGIAPNSTEVFMTGYEIVFHHGDGTPEEMLQLGETVEIGGSLWEVSDVDLAGPTPRVHLSQLPAAEVAAHRRPQVALAPPTSFEAELVYTLNDLSSRLNVLASTLNAYWGRGAA